MTRTIIAVLASTIAALSTGCSDEAKDPNPPGGKSSYATCSQEDLASARLIASRTFERETSKPKTERLEFEHVAGDALCVVVATGVVGTHGEETRQAVSSMRILLDDDLPIADPRDFNAHPQLVSRHVDAAGLTAGPHALTVTVTGKPGSVATVAVMGVGSAPNDTASRVRRDQLEDPDRMATTVRDQLIVTTSAETTKSELQSALQTLPFAILIIGQVGSMPLYQAYVPGGSASPGGLSEYADVLRALPSIHYAGPHYAAVLADAHDVPLMPDPGTDQLYVNGDNFTNAAWHLKAINAQFAWAHQTDGAPVAVLDSGFNLNHPDLLGHITCTSAAEDCEPAEEWAACKDAASQNCSNVKTCYGSKPGKSHGTQVAGLIAASANTTHTVGVSWNTQILATNYNKLATIENLPPDVEKKYAAGRPVPTMHWLVALDDFTKKNPGVRVINVSAGTSYYCRNGESVENYWPGDKNRLVESAMQFGITEAMFLAQNRNILLVKAAGNEGDKGSASVYASSFGGVCAFRNPGFFTENKLDPTIAYQGLCVAASNRDSNGVESYSNLDGDPLAAPVGNFFWGNTIGTLDYESAGALHHDQGTSLAAPQVAAVAALAFGANDQLSAAHVRAMLIGRARPLYYKYHNTTYGLLDAHAVLMETESWTCDGYVQKQDGDGRVCPSFWDVPESNWSYKSVHQLACNCVLKGYSDGSFKPGNIINRAELLKVIVETTFPQATIEQFSSQSAPFSDVPSNEWFTKYVALGASKNIVDTSVSQFLPANEVTRAEAVTFLARAALALMKDEIADPDNSPVPQDSLFATLGSWYLTYTDSNAFGETYPDVDLQDWFYAPAEAAAKAQIMCGYDTDQDASTPKQFLPAAKLNRAEASHIACLSRYGLNGPCSDSACEN